MTDAYRALPANDVAVLMDTLYGRTIEGHVLLSALTAVHNVSRMYMWIPYKGYNVGWLSRSICCIYEINICCFVDFVVDICDLVYDVTATCSLF